MKKDNFRKKGKPQHSELYVDNWSSFQEYIQYKPERIKRIECSPKEMKRVHELLSSSSLNVPVDNDQEFLRVFVKEGFSDEIALEQKLGDEATIVALDHITDTRNLGAILRTAAFFGVKTVIAPNKRQAPIAQGTMATCQGALVHTNIYSVVNLVRSLRKLKELGYWIVGTDMGGEPMEAYQNKFEKVVIVMGSEDKGLSRLVRQECDVIVSIPGAELRVESLNVAVASGIAIHLFTKPKLTV